MTEVFARAKRFCTSFSNFFDGKRFLEPYHSLSRDEKMLENYLVRSVEIVRILGSLRIEELERFLEEIRLVRKNMRCRVHERRLQA